MKFRKRPVVVEAWLYLRPDDRERLVAQEGVPLQVEQAGDGTITLIETLEGRMRVMPGDWIIKGVRGEFYPCKPDIFDATYEAAI